MTNVFSASNQTARGCHRVTIYMQKLPSNTRSVFVFVSRTAAIISSVTLGMSEDSSEKL